MSSIFLGDAFDHFCSLLPPQKPLTSFSHNLLFMLLFLLTNILTNFSIRGIISSFPPKSFYLFSFILLYFQSNFSLLLKYYYRQSSITIFKDIVLATWSPSGKHLFLSKQSGETLQNIEIWKCNENGVPFPSKPLILQNQFGKGMSVNKLTTAKRQLKNTESARSRSGESLQRVLRAETIFLSVKSSASDSAAHFPLIQRSISSDCLSQRVQNWKRLRPLKSTCFFCKNWNSTASVCLSTNYSHLQQGRVVLPLHVWHPTGRSWQYSIRFQILVGSTERGTR